MTFPAPVLLADGTLPQAAKKDDPVPVPADADSQSVIRNTLEWIPIEVGREYGKRVIINNNISDYVPELRPPMAWIKDPINGWETIDAVGCDLFPFENEWGLVVKSNPNHWIALNHYDNSDTEVPAYMDYDNMVMTIAVETEQRLTVEYTISDDNDGTVLEISVPDMNLWYMPPGTVYDADGNTTVFPVQQRVLVRSEAPIPL